MISYLMNFYLNYYTGMGDDKDMVGGFAPDGSSSGFYGSSRSSPRSQTSQNFDINNSDRSGERFSRKVFVGGLPPDIDEGKPIDH